MTTTPPQLHVNRPAIAPSDMTIVAEQPAPGSVSLLSPTPLKIWDLHPRPLEVTIICMLPCDWAVDTARCYRPPSENAAMQISASVPVTMLGI